MLRATCWSFSAFVAVRMRLHPSSAITPAIDSPMPRDAPVTRTVRPFRLRSMSPSDRWSIWLYSSGLNLSAPVIQVVADELSNLFRRQVQELHRIGDKDLLHLGRSKDPGHFGPDLVGDLAGKISRSEQPPPCAGRKAG